MAIYRQLSARERPTTRLSCSIPPVNSDSIPLPENVVTVEPGGRMEGEERLTERQREVLRLLAEGKHMKEVGTILNMTARTVAFHKYNMRKVLGAKSDADLVKYAVRNHLTAA